MCKQPEAIIGGGEPYVREPRGGLEQGQEGEPTVSDQGKSHYGKEAGRHRRPDGDPPASLRFGTLSGTSSEYPVHHRKASAVPKPGILLTVSISLVSEREDAGGERGRRGRREGRQIEVCGGEGEQGTCGDKRERGLVPGEVGWREDGRGRLPLATSRDIQCLKWPTPKSNRWMQKIDTLNYVHIYIYRYI